MKLVKSTDTRTSRDTRSNLVRVGPLELGEPDVRRLAAGMGVAIVAFGAAPLLAPRGFARIFGLTPSGPGETSVVRSVGLRDVVMGLGLWSAAAHGGRYAPLLLGRLLTDGGDAVAVGIAAVQGARRPRFVALGGLALAATLADAALYWLARKV
ncbi:MAG TPA: DUF4267 domain-containing protein [Ktedonobacterales bacterium]